MLIGTGIFPYIYHVGCTFNLYSIINNGLVPGGQNLSRRQTVFFFPVDPRKEDHRSFSYNELLGICGEFLEFEWNIFPGFTTLKLCDKISDLLSSLGQSPESFTGRILFMSMFNDIFCDRYDNKDECLRNANIVKTFAQRFGIGQWSFTQLFLLSEICMVILWQDYCGKGNLRKSYWNMAGRKFQIGNVSLFIVKNDYSYLCMWMT